MKKKKTAIWKEYEHNEINHSRAHYLLAIASFQKFGQFPKAADVARHLGVSRAAVSLQLRPLILNKLIRLDSTNRILLTKTGADLVARIAGKRELFRSFLQEVLGVSEETADMDSCKVEHLLSEETGAALLKFIKKLEQGKAVVR